MNNKSSFFKKTIIGAILSLILCFGLWFEAPKVKGATISPIIDLNDILPGSVITFNEQLTSLPGWYFLNSGSTYNQTGTGTFTSGSTFDYLLFNNNGRYAGVYHNNTNYYKYDTGSWSDSSKRVVVVNATLKLYNSSGVLIDSTDETFLNWFNNNAVVTYTPPVETHTLTLNANGGYFVDGNGDEHTTISDNFVVGSAYDTLTFMLTSNSLERPGYTFLGWGLTSDTTTTLTQSDINSFGTDKTIYAIWRDDSRVNIIFEKNPNLPLENYTGSLPSNQTALKNSVYNVPGNTNNLGYPHYHFIGWNTDEYATTGLSTIQVYTSNITLYSIFEVDTHTLTLNLQGGNIPGGVSQYTYDYNTQVNLNTLNTPVKVGFIFLGWGLTSDATEFISTITMTSNKTIYAIWGTSSGDLATITFNGNGNTSGATPGTIRVIKGQQYTLPSNPGELEKTGYTFIGWGLTSDATTPVLTITPSANMTLYAIWNELNYATITLQVNGNNVGVCKLYNGVLPTFYIRFNEFNDDYFYIRITANDGVNYSNVDYNYIWNIIYNYTERNGKVLYTFNGNKVEKIIITNASGVETEYDQASIDLAHYSLLYYYQNNDTYTINILTEPNTDIDSFKNIIKNIFDGTQHLLNLKIGWFTLGGLVAIVLGVGVLFFVIKIGKGGGN